MQRTDCFHPHRLALRCILAVFCCLALLPAAPALARGAVSVNIGVEIETRGPVHEAFAEPIVFEPDPGLVVPQQPPALIEEVPPDQRPDGPSVVWVPGYWSWDDDRSGFIWVSGMWRSIPPGRQFVPGYWTQTAGGYQWISGFWLTATERTVEYLPQPPAPVAVDPIGAPPAPDYIWVPGCWLWREGTYLWRPGYWIAPQPNWEWIPAHYVWTPSGYVFVSGYWDYAAARRGLLFAPAYIQPAAVVRPGFVYTPTVVINADVLVDNLFARPHYHHYYFGDYYAPEYRRVGIVPIYTFHHSHGGYSPLYAHMMAVHHHTDPQWERHYMNAYELRAKQVDARPPRTWTAMEHLRGNRAISEDPVRSRTVTLAKPLTELAASHQTHDLPFQLQRTGQQQRDDLRRQLLKVREYQAQRRQLELSSADKSPLHVSRDQIRTGQATPTPNRLETHSAQNHAGQQMQTTPQISVKPKTSNGHEARTGERIKPGEQPKSTGQVKTGELKSGPPHVQEAPRSLRLNLSRSPLAAQTTTKLEKSTTPPATPKAPKVDPKARPEPKVQPRDRTIIEPSPAPQSGTPKRS